MPQHFLGLQGEINPETITLYMSVLILAFNGPLREPQWLRTPVVAFDNAEVSRVELINFVRGISIIYQW